MTSRSLLLLTTALFPLAACSGRGGDPATAAPKGLTVSTAPVVKRDLTDQIVLAGTLKPKAQVQIVAEVPARLVRLLRDEGAHVAQGEVLAELDDTDFRLAHNRASAALAMAEANQAHAVAEKERADSLLKTGGITDRDHLSAQVALKVADASLAQARAEEAIAAQQLARTRVTAPFTGRLGKRSPDPGALLAAGSPLFTLVDDSVLEFEAQVPSREYAKVKLRAPVSLAVDALPGMAIEGHLARIEPLVDERTRSFQVVVEVPGRPGLVGGLFARATVDAGTITDALVVPPAALVRDGADPARAEVFVVREGKADKVAVAVGVESPDGIQVTRGLSAGDVLVLDPPTALTSGSPVVAQAQDDRQVQAAQAAE